MGFNEFTDRLRKLIGRNTPTGGCSFDDVSSLMEFAAYIGIERQSWDED